MMSINKVGSAPSPEAETPGPQAIESIDRFPEGAEEKLRFWFTKEGREVCGARPARELASELEAALSDLKREQETNEGLTAQLKAAQSVVDPTRKSLEEEIRERDSLIEGLKAKDRIQNKTLQRIRATLEGCVPLGHSQGAYTLSELAIEVARQCKIFAGQLQRICDKIGMDSHEDPETIVDRVIQIARMPSDEEQLDEMQRELIYKHNEMVEARVRVRELEASQGTDDAAQVKKLTAEVEKLEGKLQDALAAITRVAGKAFQYSQLVKHARDADTQRHFDDRNDAIRDAASQELPA